MKYTLLELVQLLASSMDSDEINSIGDSTEAGQIATLVKTVYMSIVSRLDLPEHFSLVNLTPSNDPDQPNLMYVPDTVDQIVWIKYDGVTSDDDDGTIRMANVPFMRMEDFLARMFSQDTVNDENVISYTLVQDSNSIPIVYRNDRPPCYYTTFDDHTLIFDSLDVGVDDTLKASKSLAYCKLAIPFTMEDDFTPDLDDSQFDLLINECKSLAWAELKQTQHAKAEQWAKRGWTRQQRNKHETEQVSDFDRLPNFGRK